MAITIRELFVKLGFEADTKQGEEFEKQVDDIGEGLGDLADKAKGFAIAFGASVAAAFGVAAISEFLGEQQEAVKEIEQRRGALAATAEEMQRLGFVAREAGFEMDELSDAIVDLAEKTADADLTGAGYKENLDKLGLSARDLSGKMKDPIQLFLEFSDAIAGMEDGGEKAFVAMELMGDAGKNMIPLLNQGSAGIKEMMLAADAAGFIMTDSTIAATLKYSEASRRLTDAIVMLKSIALDPLLPIITAITEQITEWLMDTDLISAALLRLRQAAIVTGAALAAMAAGKFARALTQLPALISTVTNGMRALRAMLLSTNAAMIAIPLAIAGVLLAGQDLFTWVQGGDSLIGNFIDQWAESDGILGSVARTIQDLKPVAEKMFDVLSKAAGAILPALTSMLAMLADAFMTALAPAIVDVVTELVAAFQEMSPLIAETATMIGEVIADVVVMAAKIIAVFATTIFPVIRLLLPMVIATVTNILAVIAWILPAVVLIINIIAAIIRGVAPIVTGVVSVITNVLVVLAAVISAIITGIAEAALPMINSIVEAITGAVDFIGGALGTLIGWFRDAFDAIAEIVKPVADSIAAVVKGVAAITGGASVLNTVARAAPQSMINNVQPRERRSVAGAGAGGGAMSIGKLSVNIGGSTNMGPAELSGAVRDGAFKALMDAQLRAAARGLG